MDPYTLAYLAGHSDFATTKRYVHPELRTVRAAMEKAQERLKEDWKSDESESVSVN
jgi:hypothetical protein